MSLHSAGWQGVLVNLHMHAVQQCMYVAAGICVSQSLPHMQLPCDLCIGAYVVESSASLRSLAMVLNTLQIDPRRAWKGPWRWFHEQMLDCCLPVARVAEVGMVLDQAGPLLREVLPSLHNACLQDDAVMQESRGPASPLFPSLTLAPSFHSEGCLDIQRQAGADIMRLNAVFLCRQPAWRVAMARGWGCTEQAPSPWRASEKQCARRPCQKESI